MELFLAVNSYSGEVRIFTDRSELSDYASMYEYSHDYYKLAGAVPIDTHQAINGEE